MLFSKTNIPICFSKDGYLFDKEVILEYVIRKKNEYSRQLKEYERLKKKEEEESALQTSKELDNKISSFLKTENNIVSKFAHKNDTSEFNLCLKVCFISVKFAYRVEGKLKVNTSDFLM